MSAGRSGMTFSLTVVAVVVAIALVIGVLGGRVFTTQAEGASGGEEGSAASGTSVDVIVKATDSAFWQTMLAGSQDAGEDYNVDLGTFGPTSETDVNEQVTLVENSISRGVDAIAIASNSSDALNSVIDRARDQGIYVITVDNQVTTESDGFIGTDNRVAGNNAGERLCELVQEESPDGGQIYIENAVAGVQVLEEREDGFREQFEADCPDYEITDTRFNDNDVATATSNVNDAITATPNLVGIFAANNVSGVGTAQAIQDNDASDEIPVVAFDSDEEEVAALEEGQIDALIVQNPYFFGYQAVIESIMATQERIIPPELDPGGVLVDRDNLDQPEVQELVNPPTADAGEEE